MFRGQPSVTRNEWKDHAEAYSPYFMLRQSLETELAAASAIAAKAGLGPVSPEILHLGNHSTALLHPWPIIARIASGTSFDLESASASGELTIAAHLARRHAPSVRPTQRVPAGPYFEKDCAITLWEFVEGRAIANEADELAAATALRQIHSALAGSGLNLPSYLAKVDSCETILASGIEAPKLASTDRIFLLNLYRGLRERLNNVGGNWRPLHGDAHIGNAMMVGAGAIWMDLESVCLGPLEWDVGFLPAATWSQFTGADEALVRLLADVRSCCVATWCWAEFDRSAATQEAALCHLGELKERFN